MPTTTPNFGWSVPVSTDLVKDGATAIELLGDSIDASLVDLKGGTTGQVLAKASGTDMDFSWVAQDDSNAIQNAIVDAKGDLISASASDTPARLAVGANGAVLTADSAEATGLKWATPVTAVSGLTLITSQTIGSAVASVTVTGAFSATYDNYFITIAGGSSSVNTNGNLTLGATTTGYYMTGTYFGSYNNTPNAFAINNGANWTAAYMTTNAISARIELQSPFLSKNTTFSSNPIGAATTSFIAHYAGYLADTTSYTAFTLTTGSGTMTGGEIRVYGYQNS